MNREKFERLVSRAIEALPEEFIRRLENIDIVVQDGPTLAQLALAGQGSTLFGLYEGVPLTQRGTEYNLVLPDKITIFQKPIEAEYRHDGEVIAEIQRVVRHEIAHHFGLEDFQLEEIENKEEGSQH